MASEIKANKISPATGTAFTLGDSGDTFTLPSGATLAVASGATISNAGSASGFFDGLKEIDYWETTTQPTFSSGAYYYFGSNGSMSRSTVNFTSPIGTGVSYSGSDWSYPSTGTYLISWQTRSQTASSTIGVMATIWVTTDNFSTSSAAAASANSEWGQNNMYCSNTALTLQTITDITQQKFRISEYNYSQNTTHREGNLIVIKVAD